MDRQEVLVALRRVWKVTAVIVRNGCELNVEMGCTKLSNQTPEKMLHNLDWHRSNRRITTLINVRFVCGKFYSKVSKFEIRNAQCSISSLSIVNRVYSRNDSRIHIGTVSWLSWTSFRENSCMSPITIATRRMVKWIVVNLIVPKLSL